MRILFITSSRLGDAVISSGVIERIRLAHPEARLTVACGAASAGVFASLPGLERLIVFEKQSLDRHWFSLWAEVVRHWWHLIVDFRGSALSLLLPAGRRVIVRGGRRPGRRYVQIGVALGFDPAPLPVAWTAPEDRARAAILLPEGGTVLGLGPTANWDGKIWPAERFGDLARRLGVPRIAIFGGPGSDERARAAPVLAALPDAIDLVGAVSVPEAAACLARCALFVGNDSGLMHLAAAAGTPTLGLFGRSRASEYAPAGVRASFVAAPGPEGEAPMDGLAVDQVVATARALLGTTVPA
ncbi:glycosyltransferase family 9 protein [Acidiphilium sp. AL]|uniref:Glycosyltransferase family 9 protein n=1 Tax=Acidiphilium iwatense TaxID=768198 RepID=A0ABS9DVW5_9PROT|nr:MULTISPECIES: glycosyltransferase family 9 protein [Acidiphilium]MCF3945925.1 glycosyltransferase family 9 protein [Acidiphilium iwatense]MCU4159194.1 glycosyltransferase family 9 protein [Acidiphilium sp. AL]